MERAGKRAAAFFDVDGTIVDKTIVHYYMYFRRRQLSPLVGSAWQALYYAKCIYYLLLDRIDRTRLNEVFYRDYRGLSAGRVRDLAGDCYTQVVRPSRFVQVEACVGQHRAANHRIVLVTGSLDFIMAPLASELGADDVLAARLQEEDGRFTGRLVGAAVGAAEKARLILAYADSHGIDLAQSHAYGDSIADLPMLEAVGHPHVVNGDKALTAIARARSWPQHTWTVAGRNGAVPR